MPYAFKHEGKVYGPDGPIKDMDGHELQPSDADNYNKGLEAIELEEWKLQPHGLPTTSSSGVRTGCQC